MFLKKLNKSKPCKSNTKFPFQTVYFLGVRELITSFYTVYDCTTSGHMDLYSIYIYTYTYTYCTYSIYIYIYLYTVYIHFYIMYLLLMQYIHNGISSIVFGMVYSDRTGVVLLHKHFSSWLSTSFNSTSIITNCTLLWVNLTLGVSQQFIHLLQVVLLHLIFLQYWLSFTDILLG